MSTEQLVRLAATLLIVSQSISLIVFVGNCFAINKTKREYKKMMNKTQKNSKTFTINVDKLKDEKDERKDDK